MHNAIISNNLSAEQARQMVDCRQIFAALREAEAETAHRFRGSVEWRGEAGQQYLYRRRGRVAKSLGPRSAETEAAHQSFLQGKERLAAMIRGLRARLEAMAPVNRALGLNRVPDLVARILRRLDGMGLLGSRVAVVGTNALFAYEAAAGVQFRSALLATRDVDLAVDARRRLVVLADMPAQGLFGVLQKIDPGFSLPRAGAFRAVNRDGFMVDLITPALRDATRPRPTVSVSHAMEDMAAVDLPKLQWLVEAPRFEAMAIAANGLPLRLVVADPRFFAAHKFWLAEREDREADKRIRDREQGLAVAALLAGPLSPLSLDDTALSALPPLLRGWLRRAVAEAPRPAPQW